jgi:prophage DNA circulation protein
MVTETGDTLTELTPAITDVLTALRNAAANPLDAINLLSLLANFRIPYNLVTGDDQYGLGLQYLALATAQAVRVLSIYQLGQAVSDYSPNSQQDAFELRQRVATLIDREMTLATMGFKDNYYEGMSQLRVTLVLFLNNIAINLPPSEQYSFNANLPAVVLAYRLYQDTTLEADLVARNIPVDPGFMSLQIEALVPNS